MQELLQGLFLPEKKPLKPCRLALRWALGQAEEEDLEAVLKKKKWKTGEEECLSALREDAWERREYLIFDRFYDSNNGSSSGVSTSDVTNNNERSERMREQNSGRGGSETREGQERVDLQG